jgi:hypothetical protein
MKRQQPIVFLVVLAMMAATAGVLAHTKANQKLGLPGVKTRPLPGSQNLEVLLPVDLPGYKSEARDQAGVVTNMLPHDTSFGQRLYTSDSGFESLANVVLMGTSRSSIHDPQVCLTAQGWKIDNAASHVETVHVDRPLPYDLPVRHIIAARQAQINGQIYDERGIYVYWYVDADHYAPTPAARNLIMARDVLLKGELDRWAYISFFAVCGPGQEEATFNQIKKLIQAAVPEFQLVPHLPK